MFRGSGGQILIVAYTRVRKGRYRIAVCEVKLQPVQCIHIFVLLKYNYSYTNLVLCSKNCYAFFIFSPHLSDPVHSKKNMIVHYPNIMGRDFHL